MVKGNETGHSAWISGTTYVTTLKAYDGTYGLITQSTDANGKNTAYAYDSYNLYPATVTNALSQATSYTYDYSSGQVKQKTDPNNRVFQFVYDGLDRLLAEKQPDLGSPSNLVNKTEYVYTDTPGAVSVQKKDYLSSSAIVSSYTYYDGLGRKLQERKQAEGSNYEVKDYAYNNLDLLQKESLAYFSSGSTKTAATTTSSLYINYAYDPLYRITTTTDAVGTQTNAYSDWKTIITDKRGKNKDLYKDAYGNLIRVDEHNGASTYTTSYTYNGLGNLTKITDTLGNVRNFTYDGAGRRLSAEDLHASGDSTFGVWNFQYDGNNNLIYRIDPKGQEVYYEYDDLNRILAEDYAGQEGMEVIYEYDMGTDGIGRLCNTITPEYEEFNTYNPLGNMESEVKTINAEEYTTSYTYDRQGNILTITSPDNSVIKYEYGTGGLLNKVSRKESSDGSYVYVVSNIDYSPMQQVTAMAYQNGMNTANTYDATKLYRLTSKVTTIAGNAKGQDIAYTYDNNGNIATLIDNSNTASKKNAAYTYDDLNRLTSATVTNVATGQTPYTENYTYDAIGNILTKTGAGSYSYTGDEGDSFANPHAVTDIDGLAFSYDENGNLTSKGEELINSWDYNNRLISTVAGDITDAYTYDASGQRLTLSDGGMTRIYLSKFFNTDGGDPVKHIFAADTEIATVTGSDTGAVIRYTATDHLTGSNITTNSSDNQEELLDYRPWGTIRIDQKAGDYSDQRKYAGHEFDNDTGLSYMDARYYDPATGRFLSQDPAFLAVGNSAELKEKTKMELERYLSDPQLANSYSYVANNPLKYTDSTGDFLDIALDVGFIGYDLYKMGSAVWNGNWSEAKSESVNLGLDVGGAVLPGVTGLGAIRRTGEAAKVADKAKDAVNLSSREILNSWRNTTMDSTYKTIKYHLEKHGFGRTLSQYTKDGTDFYNTYKNQATKTILGNGETGLKIKIPGVNYYGIYDKTGKQVTHGPIRENRPFLNYKK